MEVGNAVETPDVAVSPATDDNATHDDNNDNEPVDDRLRKPLSAYFHFANFIRPQLLESARQQYGKVDVSAVGKEIGRQWSEMNEADKQQYIQLATEDKQRYDTELAQRIADGTYTDTGNSNTPHNPDTQLILPTSRVKKLMLLDQETKNVQKEALALITKATELFIAHMCERIHAVCETAGRKRAFNIDYAVVLRRDQQYEWLSLSLQTFPTTQTEQKDDDDDADDDEQKEATDGLAGVVVSGDDVDDKDAADTDMNGAADKVVQDHKENTSPKQRAAPNSKLAQVSDLTTLLRAKDTFVTIQPRKAHKAKTDAGKRKKSLSAADDAAAKKTKAGSNKADATTDKANQPISSFFQPNAAQNDAVEVDDDD